MPLLGVPVAARFILSAIKFIQVSGIVHSVEGHELIVLEEEKVTETPRYDGNQS